MEKAQPQRVALLLAASSDAEFEELWQRLSRDSRPATPPSAPSSPEPRAADDELREILEHDLRAPDPRPAGWGMLTGLDSPGRRQRPCAPESASVERSPDREDSAAQLTLQEPVLARSTTGLVAAAEAEIRARKLQLANDDADAEIERLKKLVRQRADENNTDERTEDSDENNTDKRIEDWGSSGDEDEEEDSGGVHVDERRSRRSRRLRWADMLRHKHSSHLTKTRQKLGAHALWKVVKEENCKDAPPLTFVERWIERTGRRKIRPDLPSVEFVRDWLAGRNGQQRDVADVEQWQRELNSAKATCRRLEQAHQRRPSFSNGVLTDESVEYEQQTRQLRYEMRQLRANIQAGKIVRREAVRDGCGPPARSAQRPPSFGSVKKWELLLRETYADCVREHGIAPGVHRLRKELEAKCGARLAPRFPRCEEDADLHPWNNDPRQKGTRAALRCIDLYRMPGHLAAYNRIPTTAIGASPAAGLSSNAYGRGC